VKPITLDLERPQTLNLKHVASLTNFAITPKAHSAKSSKKARMMAPPARKKGGQKRLDTKSFGDHIVADHTVVKANVEEGVKGETVALHGDEGHPHTQFRHVYPSQTKSSESCLNAFNHFLSHKDEVGAVYTDNSRELIATIGELGYRQQTSTEYVDSSKALAQILCSPVAVLANGYAAFLNGCERHSAAQW
jgi:hypothetical protein